MSKRFVGMVVALAAIISAPVFAVGEEDSPAVYCAEEARDAGITEATEIQSYVADCVGQIKQELAQEQMIEREGGVSPEGQEGTEAKEHSFVNSR